MANWLRTVFRVQRTILISHNAHKTPTNYLMSIVQKTEAAADQERARTGWCNWFYMVFWSIEVAVAAAL